MTETIKIVGDNLTLDLILWRKHGLRGLALIEETMKLNPDLTGVLLPIGVDVTIPDLAQETATFREVVTLFD
ncbi:tail protein X [Roseibium aggregatum]|uniref:tail protein X n=1 Tax=Roseibium aggregatum TaxID=187304 RepID=UPI001E30D880|nr:tail protein X [Roseibium aggregatum]